MRNCLLVLRFDAFALAMKAQVGPIDVADVDALRQRIEQEIDDPADPLRRAVTHFATQFELVRYDDERLCDLGRDLSGAVERLNYLAPDAHRVDIHG